MLVPEPLLLLLFHLKSDTEGLRSTKGCGASISCCMVVGRGESVVAAVVDICVQAPVKPLQRSAMSRCSVLLSFYFRYIILFILGFSG